MDQLKKNLENEAKIILAGSLSARIVKLNELYESSFTLEAKDVAAEETEKAIPSVSQLVDLSLVSTGESSASPAAGTGDTEIGDVSGGIDDSIKNVLASELVDTSSTVPSQGKVSKKRKIAEAGAGESKGEGVDGSAGKKKSNGKKEAKQVVMKTVVQGSQTYSKLSDLMRIELYEILEMLSAVKANFQLHVPRIEDGNNFGVAVQEEVITEISKSEEYVYMALEKVTKYFASRGTIVAKMIKSPQVLDYRNALVECDRQSVYRLRVTISDIRNNLLSLTDIIEKNKSKLENPRGTSSAYGSSMY